MHFFFMMVKHPSASTTCSKRLKLLCMTHIVTPALGVVGHECHPAVMNVTRVVSIALPSTPTT